MPRRKRYTDVISAGRSEIARFPVGAAASDRHGERLRIALSYRRVLEFWCRQRGFTLTITNSGHHWKLTGPLLAEWWPSSAKLVFNKRWDHGIHCHDVEQLATLVGKRCGG